MPRVLAMIQICRKCRANVDYDCLCNPTGDHQNYFYCTMDEWVDFKNGIWARRWPEPLPDTLQKDQTP